MSVCGACMVYVCVCVWGGGELVKLMCFRVLVGVEVRLVTDVSSISPCSVLHEPLKFNSVDLPARTASTPARTFAGTDNGLHMNTQT